MSEDSSPDKWVYKLHTRVKHEILENYLLKWIPSLGKYNALSSGTRGRVCYFDGFAGRGEYEDGSPGSPLIAIRVADRLIEQKVIDEVTCVFTERDEENFANLQNVIKREKTNYPRVNVLEPIKGSFADVVSNIMEKVGARLAPSFFFIDPFGFKGVPFGLVKDILSIPRTEIFLTFMYRDINRFLALTNLQSVFDELFGTSEWKQIVKNSASERERENSLRELYVNQLKQEAKARFTWAYRVCEDQKTQTLYYLIHATNHFKGLKYMKEVMYKQSGKGLFCFLGADDITSKAQMRLFDEDIDSLKKFLLHSFSGRTITYDQILEESYMDTPLIDTHYRQALQELRKGKKINVKPVTSKKAGLQGRDEIIFP